MKRFRICFCFVRLPFPLNTDDDDPPPPLDEDPPEDPPPPLGVTELVGFVVEIQTTCLVSGMVDVFTQSSLRSGLRYHCELTFERVFCPLIFFFDETKIDW